MPTAEALPSKSARQFLNSPALTSARTELIRATIWGMRVELLTREYPPHIYGGAGVHVDELARVLRGHIKVAVRCFDGPRTQPVVTSCDTPPALARHNPSPARLAVDLLLGR